MTQAKPPLLLIAAGGTGGHMFPAQALAEAMLARGWRVRLSTDPRGARFAGGFPEAVEYEEINSATTANRNPISKLLVLAGLSVSVLKSAFRMRRSRPTMVIGFGGYPTIPALAAAHLLKIPTLLHEQNGVLGKVNEKFALKVQKIACGTWPTQLPEGVNAIYTGNPVREAIMRRAGAGYIAPGDYPMSILVIGGSQGARILSDNVPPAIASLPEHLLKHISVSHQARHEDMDRVRQYYDAHGIRADVQPFFRDIATRIAQAQLVISRAGASSVADLSIIGTPSILVPLAHALRDEQTANARQLVDAGAAVLMNEDQLSPESMSLEIAAILEDSEEASLMAASALSQGRPDATDALANLVEELAAEV